MSQTYVDMTSLSAMIAELQSCRRCRVSELQSCRVADDAELQTMQSCTHLFSSKRFLTHLVGRTRHETGAAQSTLRHAEAFPGTLPSQALVAESTPLQVLHGPLRELHRGLHSLPVEGEFFAAC